MSRKSVYLIVTVSVLSWMPLAAAGDFVEDFESYEFHAPLDELPNWTTVVFGSANTEVTGGDYFIDDINGSRRLHSPRGGNTIAVINPDVLTLGAGSDLEMSVDIYYRGVAIGNGLIFYYQDQDNFYYVEMTAPNNSDTFRFRKRVGGTTQTIIEQTAAGLQLTTEYRLHVQYKVDSNTFDIWLETLDDGNVVHKFEDVADDAFRGGQVGVWAHSSFNGIFDNLTVAGGPSGQAEASGPAHGAVDVPRDNVVLSWTPGDFAQTHDVYLGTVLGDVEGASASNPLDVVLSQGQDANTVNVGRLDFDQTYYWRVDEVNGPPDNTIFTGPVWNFQVEPFSIPISTLSVTASSAHTEDMGPEKTIDGSGLNELDQHSTEDTAMWLAGMGDAAPTLQYEFDKAYKLHEMWVWNSNQKIESFIGIGAKDVIIETSMDADNWTVLEGATQLAQAPGAADYTANTIFDFQGIVARYVRITIMSGHGIAPQQGLSEVRFSYIPVWARQSNPVSGAADLAVDTILSFRAGREATRHGVYLGTNEQAVIDGTVPVATVTEPSYAASLDLATTYYWRVDEANDTESPSTWQGDVWNFSTEAFIVVDDFESYTNDPDTFSRVFQTWIDGAGYAVPVEVAGNGTGSYMGHDPALGDIMEKDLVHGARQSAPIFYGNGAQTVSEVERSFDTPQDWTGHGVQGLVLHFYGDPANGRDQLYLKVNGTRHNYDGDAEAIQRVGWQKWYVPLADLIGVDLTQIRSLTIGVAGAGPGVLYIDDIVLTNEARELITPVQPDPAGLLLHYEFEGNSSDSTGVNNGTALGSPAYEAGKIGQALSFDGVDDHVAIENLHYAGGGHAEVSVCAWIRTNSEADQIIVSFDRNEYWRLEINGDGAGPGQVGWDVGTDTGLVDSGSKARVDDGQWHHIAGTFDNGTLTIYVDGNADESSSGGPTFGSGNARFGYIGTGSESTTFNADPKTPVWLINGAVDDVRIYDRALTPEEIAGLAGRTKAFDNPF